MTSMELNAELFRNLSYIADDEDSMKKVVKYIKKLVSKKEEKEDCMSKEEILAEFDTACKNLKLYKEGKLKARPMEELLAELEAER